MFDLAEIRILMDVILSTPSISAAKAQELQKSWAVRLSCYQARTLRNSFAKAGGENQIIMSCFIILI